MITKSRSLFLKTVIIGVLSLFSCANKPSLEQEFGQKMSEFGIVFSPNLKVEACYRVEDNGIFDDLEGCFVFSLYKNDLPESFVKLFSNSHVAEFKEVWMHKYGYYIEAGDQRIPESDLPDFEDETLSYLYMTKSEWLNGNEDKEINIYENPSLAPTLRNHPDGFHVLASATITLSIRDMKMVAFMSDLP